MKGISGHFKNIDFEKLLLPEELLRPVCSKLFYQILHVFECCGCVLVIHQVPSVIVQDGGVSVSDFTNIYLHPKSSEKTMYVLRL